MEKQKYISTTELAKLLGISRIAVYKKVKKREIKAIKIGKMFAIPMAEVRKMVGNIIGHPLTEEEKKEIDRAIDRMVAEYGEVLRLLGEK